MGIWIRLAAFPFGLIYPQYPNIMKAIFHFGGDMPLSVLSTLPETTAGGMIAIVIIVLVLWYFHISDRALMSVLALLSQNIKDNTDVISKNITSNTDTLNKQNVVMATSTEVLRNLTDDIKEIKAYISPEREKRKAK